MALDESPRWSAAPEVMKWLKVAVVVLVLSVVASVGLGVGQSRDADTHVASGRAYLGTDVATVTVRGQSYAFDITAHMIWYDGQRMHEGGVPPCLENRPGYTDIRFGYATAHGPDDSSWPVVTWVQCVDPD